MKGELAPHAFFARVATPSASSPQGGE